MIVLTRGADSYQFPWFCESVDRYGWECQRVKNGIEYGMITVVQRSVNGTRTDIIFLSIVVL